MPHLELQIVASIHVPDNLRTVINFLDIACPIKVNPMARNVLHLVKLRGQATQSSFLTKRTEMLCLLSVI